MVAISTCRWEGSSSLEGERDRAGGELAARPDLREVPGLSAVAGAALRSEAEGEGRRRLTRNKA